MNSKSGEAMIIGAVIGLIGSVIVTYFSAANDAQLAANASGREVSPREMVDGGDALQAVLATGAGAAAGWAVEELKDDDKSDQRPEVPTVQVTAGGDAQVTVSGNDASSGNDQGNRPTTTTTSTTPATPAAE